MAKKRRYPHWAVGITPPPGVITTPIGAIKLVNVRRQLATTGMHTIALILDDRASDHSTTADSLQGLKRHYDQRPPNTDCPVYRFESAIDLSKKLVERASDSLNQMLYEESARLKACPDAALWVGIPISLVPGNIKAVNQQPQTAPSSYPRAHTTQSTPRATTENTANRDNRDHGYPARFPTATTQQPTDILPNTPNALFSDVVQISAPVRPRQGLNYISPLETVAPNPNQVFFDNLGPISLQSYTQEETTKEGTGTVGESLPAREYRTHSSTPTNGNQPDIRPKPVCHHISPSRQPPSPWPSDIEHLRDKPECQPIHSADRILPELAERPWTIDHRDPMTQNWLLDMDFYESFVHFNVHFLNDILLLTMNSINLNVGIKSVNCYPGVVNLSDKILSNAELSLLSKGLTFVDTPDSPDMGVISEDLHKFHLGIKRYSALGKFKTPTTNYDPPPTQIEWTSPEPPFGHPKFRNPSKWNPPGPMIVEHMSLLNQEQLVDKHFPRKTLRFN